MSEVKTIVGLLTLAPATMKTVSGESCRHVLLESEIGNVIREAGMHAVSGGDPYPEEDRIATSCSLARRHVHTLMDFDPACTIIHVSLCPDAGDVLACVRYLERELKCPPRLVLFANPSVSDGATTSALDARAALMRAGYYAPLVLGGLNDKPTVKALLGEVHFQEARQQARPGIIDLVERLKRQKHVIWGGLPDRTLYDAPDPDELMRVLGCNLEAHPIEELLERVSALSGDGSSCDPRVQKATESGAPSIADAAMSFAAHDLMIAHEASTASVTGSPDGLAWTESILMQSSHPGLPPRDRLPCMRDADVHLAITAWMTDHMSGPEFTTVRIRNDDWQLDFGESPVMEGDVSLSRLHRTRSGYELAAIHGSIVLEDGIARLSTSAEVERLPSARWIIAKGHRVAPAVEFTQSVGIGFSLIGH